MTSLYRNSWIAFQYPENWQLDESQTADAMTINLQSPSSAFLFLTAYDRSRTPIELADQALDAMLEEYPELESLSVEESIANRRAVGHDLNFFSLDLTNTCWIRAFTTGEHTVLLFAQTSDLDLESTEPVVRGILASLEIDD